MPAAFVKEFEFNGQVITSVVMDEDEFLSFCDELLEIFWRLSPSSPGERADADQIAKIKAGKHLPMMALGSKTAKFFERYGIKSKYASFIVRGQGPNVAKRYLD